LPAMKPKGRVEQFQGNTSSEKAYPDLQEHRVMIALKGSRALACGEEAEADPSSAAAAKPGAMDAPSAAQTGQDAHLQQPPSSDHGDTQETEHEASSEREHAVLAQLPLERHPLATPKASKDGPISPT
jgi:hypothetical protein